MSLFDQMLVRQCIPNEKLQLVAATGYLLASKLRETCPVTPAELEALTYSSCSEQEIRQFEMVMTVSLGQLAKSVVTYSTHKSLIREISYFKAVPSCHIFFSVKFNQNKSVKLQVHLIKSRKRQQSIPITKPMKLTVLRQYNLL